MVIDRLTCECKCIGATRIRLLVKAMKVTILAVSPMWTLQSNFNYVSVSSVF